VGNSQLHPRWQVDWRSIGMKPLSIVVNLLREFMLTLVGRLSDSSSDRLDARRDTHVPWCTNSLSSKCVHMSSLSCNSFFCFPIKTGRRSSQIALLFGFPMEAERYSSSSSFSILFFFVFLLTGEILSVPFQPGPSFAWSSDALVFASSLTSALGQ